MGSVTAKMFSSGLGDIGGISRRGCLGQPKANLPEIGQLRVCGLAVREVHVDE